MNPVRDNPIIKIMDNMNYKQVGIMKITKASRMRLLGVSCL